MSGGGIRAVLAYPDREREKGTYFSEHQRLLYLAWVYVQNARGSCIRRGLTYVTLQSWAIYLLASMQWMGPVAGGVPRIPTCPPDCDSPEL